MFFWLKKLIAFWLMPLPFCLAAMMVGALLTFSPKRRRAGRMILLGAVVLLMLFSNKFVSKWLIRPLETRYPAMPEFVSGGPIPPELAACRYIVVLGGGTATRRAFRRIICSPAPRSRASWKAFDSRARYPTQN